jgi:transcriptional regulator with XRE-family HTH domain
MMTIYEKFEALLNALKLNPNQFAKELGVKTTVIYHVLKGRNKPGFDLIDKVIRIFAVNPAWLISDAEKMFIDNELSMAIFTEEALGQFNPSENLGQEAIAIGIVRFAFPELDKTYNSLNALHLQLWEAYSNFNEQFGKGKDAILHKIGNKSITVDNIKELECLIKPMLDLSSAYSPILKSLEKSNDKLKRLQKEITQNKKK